VATTPSLHQAPPELVVRMSTAARPETMKGPSGAEAP
jgi:hypothetical protein